MEDDYPEFTEALLEMMFPHYLRPFRSCSIARFDLGTAAGKLSAPVRVPRGTQLQSRPVRGVSCRFRTAYDVHLAPIAVQAARYSDIAQPPLAVELPSESGGQVSLSFELQSDQVSFDKLGMDALRLFIDGEPSFGAALRDAIALRVVAAYVESDHDGRWRKLQKVPRRSVGFIADEALVESPARAHPAYRLLTELFAFPEKFGFIDLELAPMVAQASRSFTLHLVLRATRADEPVSRMLEGLGPDNILTGCTPVVNLFRQQGEPIRVTERTHSYPVVADARRAFAYEVHSIDLVQRVRQTPQGEQVLAFRPFYELH